MTDSLPLDTSPTPPPASSSSASPPSLAQAIGGTLVSLGTLASITYVLANKLLPDVTWWGALCSLLIAGMAASERLRLLGTAAKLRGLSQRKE